MMETESGFRDIGATTYLCPTPTVLVGCAENDGWLHGEGRANLITVAWVGVCCSHPPMIGIGVRPERYSHGLITRSGEFTVNLINESLVPAMDFCGVRSGRDADKFAALNLHAIPAPPLTIAPALLEAPAYLCCKLRQTVPLGSHDLLLAEVVQVRVADGFFREDGSIDEQAMRLVAYVHGKYRALGAELGFFGFSVAGDAALKRRTTDGRETKTQGSADTAVGSAKDMAPLGGGEPPVASPANKPQSKPKAQSRRGATSEGDPARGSIRGKSGGGRR